MASPVLPSSPPRRATASKQRVVRGVIAGLVDNRWEGGDRLTEAEAVEQFGVSRTPVREALLELQGLGLIELRRNCGAVFLPFGPREIREIYGVRALLEAESARLATGRLKPESLEAMIGVFRGIEEGDGIDPDWHHDRDFHAAIAEGSGNRRLAAEIFRYGNLVQLMREIVGEQALGIHQTTAGEHLTILEAIHAGDAGRAAGAMRDHLSQASESAARAVENRQAGCTSTVVN